MDSDLAKAMSKINERLASIETASKINKTVMDAFVSKTANNSIEIGKIQTHQKYSFLIFTSFFGAAWASMAMWLNTKFK